MGKATTAFSHRNIPEGFDGFWAGLSAARRGGLLFAPPAPHSAAQSLGSSGVVPVVQVSPSVSQVICFQHAISILDEVERAHKSSRNLENVQIKNA